MTGKSADWIAASEAANVDLLREATPDRETSFRSTAEDIVAALRAERARVTERLATLDDLSGP